ncbi:MAG: glycosyltransferase family 4 protein [Candidatus Aphodosoma sp.]
MKVLVISNNCFAKNNSNGRILGCLFKNIPVEDVAQFYIVNGTNDFEVCSNYFMVNDTMAIKSLCKRGDIGIVKTKADSESNQLEKMSKHRSKYGRSSFTMLIRNFIWSRFTWWNTKFEDWLRHFGADVVVFQAGDAPFMYEIAYRVSRFLNKPLVVFNTEFYYFERDNYINRKDPQFLFNYYKRKLCKKVKKVLIYADVSIYNSEWMKAHYDNEFHRPSEVIYQSSESDIVEYHENNHEIPSIVYVGSLGFRRYEPLAEIADAIYAINKDWRLSVYGMIKDEEAKILFENTPGIDYKGIVPYETALKVIADSDLLVMAEHTDPEFSKSTAYGFSTKITDYLFSGIPILAYGPADNVGMSYLRDKNGAVVVNGKNGLKDALFEILTDTDYRKKIVERGLELACANHIASDNSNRFINILKTISTVSNQ